MEVLGTFRRMASRLKPLRVMLIVFALITIVLAPTPGTRVSYEGWDMVPTLLMPTLAPLVFLVLLLDALMGRVWLVDAQGDDRSKFKTIIRINLLVAILQLVVWLPFFIKLWN